jgi:tetratricopeptide (TPR) repeat protein
MSPPTEQACELARQLFDAGRSLEAQSVCQHILSENPRHAGALHLLGLLKRDLAEYQTAIELFRRAIAVEPRSVRHFGELGKVYAAMERPDLEADVYRHIVLLEPQLSEGYRNLAIALHEMGMVQEELACYRKALELRPDDFQSFLGAASALMSLGDYQQGWPALEIIAKRAEKTHFSEPLWDGKPLSDRCILLHEEEGFGDTIQFARFVPQVCQRCTKVLLQCPHQLKELLTGQFPVLQVIAQGEPLPPFDVQCPLMSLSRIFEMTVHTIPAQAPYLKVSQEKVARWKQRLMNGLGLKVGLVWAGRPRPPRRSIEPALLEALSGIAGVQFYSLQKGDGDPFAQLPRSLCAKDLSSELTDFSQTAAAIENLDLLITIDTAVAHLGGALGKRTWVLLHTTPDWRWMVGRSDSPWYPTIRLFRQPGARDWQSVLREVRRELEALAQTSPP